MTKQPPPRIAVIGGGPAGLMAADTARAGGAEVAVFDAMASCGRKFLLAGKGGLNLTHGEERERLLSRYAHSPELVRATEALDGQAIRAFADELGIATFVGSSGRVFPSDLKAAPLLRRWLQRLRGAGVEFHLRHRWLGFEDSSLVFDTPEGRRQFKADATILALGGGSWPELGSDGRWYDLLAARGIDLAPLRPSNCGFDYPWSEHLKARFGGSAVKNISLRHRAQDGRVHHASGEFLITDYGLEGGAIYALSGALRDTIASTGSAVLELDLTPARGISALKAALAKPRDRHTLAHQLARVGIEGVKASLLRELLPATAFNDPAILANGIKALTLSLRSTRPLNEAISTAGGVCFSACDERYMLRDIPGVFCAGEMLDWEAPTGGYLLTACFATGRAAAAGALAWLAAREAAPLTGEDPTNTMQSASNGAD